MASYPLRRIPAHRFNKPSWLMAPDPSMLPIPVFNGTASLSVQRQSLVVIHATLPVSPRSLPSIEPSVFPPPPTYAEVVDMNDDLPIIEAMRRARMIDPEGYVAEAVHPEDLLPPSFDDIARMEPHLPWEEVMKRAGNIDQAALIRDTISRQGPDGLEASFKQPSEASSLLGPQTVSHRLATGIPETITESYNQLSMNTEEAARSLLILSSSKDRIRKELITFSKFITIWLHATITNRSTQPTTDTARLFEGHYIQEDEAYLRNTPTIIARVFFAGCLLGVQILPGQLFDEALASLEDLHRFAATCSFPTTSGDTRTVVDNILDKLKVDAPPGIPFRARTGFSEQRSTEPPSLTYISGIFTGAVYSPRIILKVAEVHPVAPRNVPNDSMVGQNGEHLLSASVQHPGIWTGQGDIWHAQRIQPDHGSFGMQGNTRNVLPISHGAAMMTGQDIRPNVQFFETQRPPLVSRSVQDRRMIWQSDNRISGQRSVSGGLIFRGTNETNIWALQREEYQGNQWVARQGSQIASRTSLW
ncbi:hypothetical protein F5146DRAFT_1011564 [Armillaria mellea]|nr:hypothetical protein F5146DRAFT_1011564 [Armillaria mellea]